MQTPYATEEIGDRPHPPPAPRRHVRLARLLRERPAFAAGALVMVLFVLAGAIGLVLLTVPGLKHLWADQDLAATLLPPGSDGHLLGTDNLGRDTLARLVTGIGVSFGIGVAVTIVTLVVGTLLGLIAGYFRGIPDWVIGAAVDVAWGFPLILLAVMLAGIMGPGFLSIFLAVGLLNWAGFARIIRSYALSLREQEFVDAARSIGIPSHTILWRHFVPNVLPALLVMGSYYVAVTIVVEAGVSFLGLGIQPPTPSLGQMVAEGRNYIGSSFWQVLIPGATIAFAVLGFNLLGDALRDMLDPRLSKPQA